MISNTCKNLIEESQKYHPTYAKGKLAIHLPMALIAIDKMGASEQQLQILFDNNVEKLELRKTSTLLITKIEDALGKRELFEATVLYFKEKINNSSVQEVLENHLPILIKGIFGSAFHPAIRLSYALEIDNKKEIALALASWATEYEVLNSSFQTNENSLEENMLSHSSIGSKHNFAPGNIVNRMKEIDLILTKEQITFQTEKHSFEKIRTFCLNTYANQNNFTLLHTVTACQAFSILSEYIKDKDLALKYLWQGIYTAYLSTGLTYELHTNLEYRNTSKLKFETTKDWETILKFAITSTDEHIVKIVYTAWQEYKKYKIKSYQFIAERAIATIS